MCCLATVLKSPQKLYIPLLNYLYELAMMDYEATYHKEINYCFSQVIKSMNVIYLDFESPYEGLPSMFELFCYQNTRKIPLVIAFPREKTIFIESYARV